MSNRFRISIELVLALSLISSLAFGRGFRPTASPPPIAKAGIDKLIGTWKRIGDLEADGKVRPFEAAYTQLKHVTPTHFTWFVLDPKTHRSEIGFSGRCSVKDDVYTEHIETIAGPVAPAGVTGAPESAAKPATPTEPAFDPEKVQPVNCKFRLEGDRWFHTLPAEFTSGKPQTEVWVRLKAGEKLP